MMTRKDFVSGCHQLCVALDTTFRDNDKNRYMSNQLLQWTLVQSKDGEFYLVHPPLIREDDTANRHNCSNDKYSLDEDFENDVYIDEATLQVNLKNSNDCTKKKWLEWSFSIVYSETYQTPVLYFRVQYQDGQKLCYWNQQDVDSLILHKNKSKNIEFISEEEHPITRIPSFFTHTCDFSSHWGEVRKNNEQNSNPSLALWSWLSVVLSNYVGFGLSAETFAHVEQTLLRMT